MASCPCGRGQLYLSAARNPCASLGHRRHPDCCRGTTPCRTRPRCRSVQLLLPLTARGFGLSARHVQDGIRFLRMLFQRLDGFGGWEDEQRDLAASSLVPHIVHYRQRSRPGADD
jgi:hypothetical protein